MNMHISVRSSGAQEARALEQKGGKNKCVIAGDFNSPLPALTEQLINKALTLEHSGSSQTEGVRTGLVPPAGNPWLLDVPATISCLLRSQGQVKPGLPPVDSFVSAKASHLPAFPVEAERL